MNYSKATILLILNLLGTIDAMKRGSDHLYPPYQPSQKHEANPKKRVWQEPYLLKNGIYVATVENNSKQSFRIVSVALEPDEGKKSVAFCICGERKAIEVEEVPQGPGMLFSKTSYIEPKLY